MDALSHETTREVEALEEGLRAVGRGERERTIDTRRGPGGFGRIRGQLDDPGARRRARSRGARPGGLVLTTSLVAKAEAGETYSDAPALATA